MNKASVSARAFTFKREIDLGQILTCVSIVLSVLGLGLAWNNDRLLKEKEYADRVRRSASLVTAKVERWGELSARYFEDLQPTLVDVSEKVAETHARQPANRILFKGLMDAKAKSSQRIVDEQLQVAYMELYGYMPAFQPIFDKTIADIKQAEDEIHEALSSDLQDILLDKDIRELKESPAIGKPLRDTVYAAKIKLNARIREISLPLRGKMLAVIQLSDSELANAREQPTIEKVFAANESALASGRN